MRYTSKITIDPLGHCLDSAQFFTEDVVSSMVYDVWYDMWCMMYSVWCDVHPAIPALTNASTYTRCKVYGRTAMVLAQAFEVFGIRPVARSAIKNVTFYVMSSNDDAGKTYGQYWTSLDAFPSPSMTDFYLHADHTASRIASPSASSLTYAYDPADPVPTIGGNNLPDSIGGTIPCGPLDQSPLANRQDILFFTTEVQKTPLYLSGSILATIFVSSDMKDTDFMVKVSDVYPDSKTEILIQDNAVRMRWREGGLDANYLSPDTVYKVDLNLWNTSFVVAPGHALRMAITSSNYPRFSVNPNNGLLLADAAYPGANFTAKNTLHVGGRYASKITLPIVQRGDLPNVHVLKEVQTMYPVLTGDFIKNNVDNLNKLAIRMKH
ncbi:CocE/NonD family hydrolase [archaeon]|nr:MAG: CocE/NonD family hydrolase [archaeon]